MMRSSDYDEKVGVKLGFEKNLREILSSRNVGNFNRNVGPISRECHPKSRIMIITECMFEDVASRKPPSATAFLTVTGSPATYHSMWMDQKPRR